MKDLLATVRVKRSKNIFESLIMAVQTQAKESLTKLEFNPKTLSYLHAI